MIKPLASRLAQTPDAEGLSETLRLLDLPPAWVVVPAPSMPSRTINTAYLRRIRMPSNRRASPPKPPPSPSVRVCPEGHPTRPPGHSDR